MTDTDQARNFDTRDLARKLDTYPTPLLTIPDLQKRWNCGRSTVNRFRKRFGLRSDGPADGHPVFDLLKILGLEGIADPLAVWALGTDEDRKILTAPLLSVDDLKALDRTLGGHHAETFRRRARSGKIPGIRLGNGWLFRPTLDELSRLSALRNASPVAQ